MQHIEKTLKTLADQNRLRILAMLGHHKMCVCELAFVLGITQPSVSRHLSKLMKAGIIASEQDGYWTNYYLKENNSCARTLLSNLKKWICCEKMVKSDLKKAKKADRFRLCCS